MSLSEALRKKNTRSLSYRSYQTNTIPSRQVHRMETRSTIRAATTIFVSLTAMHAPKLQDLKQKVSCGMDKAQGPTKLQTLVCEVEGYYGCEYSLPSPKGAFLLETEIESSRTAVMLVITIGTNNL